MRVIVLALVLVISFSATQVIANSSVTSGEAIAGAAQEVINEATSGLDDLNDSINSAFVDLVESISVNLNFSLPPMIPRARTVFERAENTFEDAAKGMLAAMQIKKLRRQKARTTIKRMPARNALKMHQAFKRLHQKMLQRLLKVERCQEWHLGSNEYCTPSNIPISSSYKFNSRKRYACSCATAAKGLVHFHKKTLARQIIKRKKRSKARRPTTPSIPHHDRLISKLKLMAAKYSQAMPKVEIGAHHGAAMKLEETFKAFSEAMVHYGAIKSQSKEKDFFIVHQNRYLFVQILESIKKSWNIYSAKAGVSSSKRQEIQRKYARLKSQLR